MKYDLMEILVCPSCKSTLVLTVDEENDGDIIMGSLTCEACNQIFPIEDTIPNMLPPELRS